MGLMDGLVWSRFKAGGHLDGGHYLGEVSVGWKQASAS